MSKTLRANIDLPEEAWNQAEIHIKVGGAVYRIGLLEFTDVIAEKVKKDIIGASRSAKSQVSTEDSDRQEEGNEETRPG